MMKDDETPFGFHESKADFYLIKTQGADFHIELFEDSLCVLVHGCCCRKAICSIAHGLEQPFTCSRPERGDLKQSQRHSEQANIQQEVKS